jgi:serine/threonine protein kinase
MNRFNRQEADELLRNEGIKVIFEQEGGNQKVILGRGAYGKFRVARNLINNRFAGVKKIRGESCIQESEHEADFQRELNGLPNIMPIWDSQTITSKKTAHAVLLQFMPLAGFGNGEKLVDVLRYVENEDLKRRFLIYVLKSMLVGVKGMHSRRMYHLDLKPANVVFDCRGELYIIDFGCAYREYGNKIDALLRDKKGDFRYFSPDRMAELRRRCLRAPAASLEIAEFFDGEKADIWAIGVSLLELLMERLNYIRGADLAIKWQLRNWSNAHFVQCFDSISGWSEASENSLMGCIKALLSIDPKQRPSASEVLKNPLFQDPNSQLSPAELKGLMGDFIRWKTNPPAPLASSQILGYTPGMTESGDEGVGYLLYEAPQSGAYSSVLGDDDPPLASSAKYSIIHSDDDSDSNEIRMKL